MKMTVGKSTFDVATIIEVSPTGCMTPMGLGGTASRLGGLVEQPPSFAALILSYASDINGSKPAFVRLSGVEIDIDCYYLLEV